MWFSVCATGFSPVGISCYAPCPLCWSPLASSCGLCGSWAPASPSLWIVLMLCWGRSSLYLSYTVPHCAYVTSIGTTPCTVASAWSAWWLLPGHVRIVLSPSLSYYFCTAPPDAYLGPPAIWSPTPSDLLPAPATTNASQAHRFLARTTLRRTTSAPLAFPRNSPRFGHTSPPLRPDRSPTIATPLKYPSRCGSLPPSSIPIIPRHRVCGSCL